MKQALLRKKYTLLTALLLSTAIASSTTPAWAVTDEEFKALQQQMTLFSQQLEALQQEQSNLRQENNILKEKNENLQKQNQELALSMQAPPQQQISQSNIKTETAQTMASIDPSAGKNDGMLIPGTNTKVKLGGYVKADAIHDFNVSRDGNGEDFSVFAAIPLDGSTEDQKDGNTRLHARQTRINLTTTTPTEYGDLKLFVEGDFMASQGSQTTTNGSSFGVRHAYGELGPVLIGQTWSNFMDLAAYPDSLDFIGAAGNTLIRQGQIRYTHRPDGSNNSYSIAIENPDSEFLSDPANSGVDSGIEKYPDIIAKATFAGAAGQLSLKAVGRKLETFNTDGNASDSELAYVIGASGKINAFEKDNLRFQIAYGDGIGRYIYDLAAASQGAGFTNDNRRSLETIEAWAGYASYQHWWNDRLRSNVMFGTTHVLDNPDFLTAATTNKEIYSAHGNLIWSVTDKLDVGGEYIYGHRETEDGSEGDLQRAQFSAIYKF